MLRALGAHEKTMSCAKELATKLCAAPSVADRTTFALLPRPLPDHVPLCRLQSEDNGVSKCRRPRSIAQKDDDLHDCTKKRIISTMGFAKWSLPPLKLSNVRPWTMRPSR